MIALTMIFLSVASMFLSQTVFAQADDGLPSSAVANVLEPDQWEKVDASVKRGLAWLETQQQDDGSFASTDYAQPAVTSFCVLAFLAQGEDLGSGDYQHQLTKAIDFIIDQQKANGLLSTIAPNNVPIPRDVDFHALGRGCVYNHAISALALTEAYGQCTSEQSKKLTPAIEKAIAATLEMQRWKKKQKNVGGWRYLPPRPSGDSDLSLTGWQLMFLRSARNAGFDVPEQSIDAATKYVERCFLTRKDRNVYGYIVGNNSRSTRAMAGAGILALAHAGRHQSKESIASGELILKHNFTQDNAGQLFKNSTESDRYHYGVILCTQAMFQLGGKYWQQFFPPLVETLLANQQKDGAWPPEKADRQIGSCYSASLCILSLSVPSQLLPVFQR